MRSVELTDDFFGGAISVERGDGWLRPWRLPCDRLHLFPSPDDALANRAMESSGVRLRFRTDSRRVTLTFLPLSIPPAVSAHSLDLTRDGELAETVTLDAAATSATFSALPEEGARAVDIWLPHDSPIELTGLSVEDGALCEPVADTRPRWITYGSSLTHCRRAHSPARTWPAIVARRRHYDLTALGYGGHCCLEPAIGMMIRDLPADVITLKLGINCIGGALSPRTFAAAVTGLVLIIREKHPQTPLVLISPIGYPPNETKPNVVGNTIQRMRADIEAVCAAFRAHGDAYLHYVSGLDVFSLDEIAVYSADQCHPNGDGIEVMAENFLRAVADPVAYGDAR